MTLGNALVLAGIIVPAVITLVIGLRSGRSTDYTAVSARLASVEKRLDETEGREQALTEQHNRAVRYIYLLIGALERNDITVPQPPEPLRGLETPDARA